MKAYGSATCICLLLVCMPILQPAYAGQQEVGSSPHPMLFFSPRDVPELRRKARTTHQAITQRIVQAVETMSSKKGVKIYLPPVEHEKFTSTWNEGYGNNLCSLAMYCVLFPDDGDALALAHEYMERMAMQSSWEYTMMALDEMPISHSLVGMATAYDFLYPTLTVGQRKRFFERIRKTTYRHFERFKRGTWGKWHLQNHVWNNNVALFIGAVVTAVHDPRATEWAEYAIAHLNISMKLVDLVVDGSYNEGVSYSTYTTRSMTMFLCLLDRHYGIQLYDNYWLKQHFWFLYRTLIGYKENVGIGDASPTWMYGPASMLVFLDRFVLRNGYGNWLAARIRETRPYEGSIFSPSKSQRWSTYHTEFIWYDPELGERNPDPSGEPALTLFSDWGVVTYGGGLPPNNTFFSFKSGYLHGRAINAVVNEKAAFVENIEGWSTFNAGHEHPDQNSFIFYPRGQPFVTEAYYGPKFSFLNNVLMFGPSPKAQCFPPFEGQIGECYKWLNWMLPEEGNASADIIAAYNVRGYVFTSGEAVGSYGKHLALESVYRSMLLLTPDVLLVVDHIQLKPGSTVERANAFFNMRQGELSLRDSPRYSAAILKHSGQEFHVTWTAANGVTSTAAVAGYEYPMASISRTRESQMLNISVELNKQGSTRIAYLFWRGGSLNPTSHFIQTSPFQCKLNVSVGDIWYELSVATDHRNPLHRLNWLGHTGFATLFINTGEIVTFPSANRQKLPRPQFPNFFISSIQGSGARLLAGVLNSSCDFIASSLTTLWQLNEKTTRMSTLDLCRWSDPSPTQAFPSWFNDFCTRSYTSIHGLQSILHLPGDFAAKRHHDARLVVFDDSGELASKLSALPQQKPSKIVHILRDPKAWVAYVIKYHGIYNEIRNQIAGGLMETKCSDAEILPPHKKLQQVLNEGEQDPIKILSLFWSAHATSVLQSGLSEEHLLLVWLEDLISEPEKTAERVFQFLGMPLPPASRHHLLQYTRSKVFELDSGEIIDYQNMNWWEDVLENGDIKIINQTLNEYFDFSF